MRWLRKLIAMGNTKNHCCLCWRPLQDRPSHRGDGMFLSVLQNRGLECPECGLRYCHSCVSEGGEELRCKCGAKGLSLG